MSITIQLSTGATRFKFCAEVALTVVFCMLSLSAAMCDTKSDDPVWVAIIVGDFGVTTVGHEYYGQVDPETFSALINTAQPHGFCKLTNVVTFNNSNKLQRFSDLNYSDASAGYSNTIYVRSEMIYRIIPLDDNFVKATLNPLLLKQPQARSTSTWNPKIGNFNSLNPAYPTPK